MKNVKFIEFVVFPIVNLRYDVNIVNVNHNIKRLNETIYVQHNFNYIKSNRTEGGEIKFMTDGLWSSVYLSTSKNSSVFAHTYGTSFTTHFKIRIKYRICNLCAEYYIGDIIVLIETLSATSYAKYNNLIYNT